MKSAKFKLADGFESLRIALSGGQEVAIDDAGSYETDDPAALQALEQHPAAVRADVKSQEASA
jgi:hypothetical protein